MSRTRTLAALIVGLAFSLTAWGAATADIPITAMSSTLQVDTGTGRIFVSGDLPLTLPFDLQEAPCPAAGVATATVVGGRIHIGLTGSIFGAGTCQLEVSMFGSEIGFSVPDVGESATPVLFRLDHSGSALAGPLEFRSAIWDLRTPYSSSLIGGEIAGGPIFMQMRPLYGDAERLAVLVDMIPGDSVVLQHDLDFIILGSAGFGTFNETVEYYVATPPDLQVTAIPPQVGWLIGGVLIGLGVKMSRRRVRGAS